MQELFDFLAGAYTPYHAVALAKGKLDAAGFTALDERESYEGIRRGCRYYIDFGSALLAFSVGNVDVENCRFMLAASHVDSPALRLKFSHDGAAADVYAVLETERYGGAIDYTWFDRPLRIAGRICLKTANGVKNQLFTGKENFVIPSVAVHLNRDVNKSFSVNAQVDLKPLFALGKAAGVLGEYAQSALDGDLYLVCDQPPFTSGINDEFFSSPRIDNLTSAYSSIDALIASHNDKAINIAVLFDSEEVGSSTAEGARTTLLSRNIERICIALGMSKEEEYRALTRSFLLSIDNAHALHPNHPELSSPAHKTPLGCGVVIKHHGNRNYMTDGISAAFVKAVFDSADVKYRDFYMRSDLQCGSTLGALALGNLGVKGADIGTPQLAMHSAVETAAVNDIAEMIKGIKAFYETELVF